MALVRDERCTLGGFGTGKVGRSWDPHGVLPTLAFAWGLDEVNRSSGHEMRSGSYGESVLELRAVVPRSSLLALDHLCGLCGRITAN